MPTIFSLARPRRFYKVRIYVRPRLRSAALLCLPAIAAVLVACQGSGLPSSPQVIVATVSRETAGARATPTTLVLPGVSGTPKAGATTIATTGTTTTGSQSQAAQSTPTPVARASGVTYKVEAGDSLSSIADSLGISSDDWPAWETAVLQLNSLASPDSLQAGVSLALPAGFVQHAPVRPTASPASKPSSSAAGSAPSASSGPLTSYTVQPGDTLSAIAAKIGISSGDYDAWVAEVLQLNKIDDVNDITAGDDLELPGATSAAAALPTVTPSPAPAAATYTVQPGDTLTVIAANNGVPADQRSGWVDQVVHLNGLSSPDDIVAGQQLQLPGSASTIAAPAPTDTPVPEPTATATVQASCYYTVRPGDTWASVALIYGVTLDQLDAWKAQVAAMNAIDPSVLPVGDGLRIPC